jgi:glycosyltransferase involved in cell wall biosynthesis
LPVSDQAAVAVSIVVPVRNEADNVAPLIAEITSALDGRWLYEVIYVNDGSTDATAERLAAIMKQRPNLRQIRHANSTGQSAAVRSGVRAARGAIVATLDGDGQNNPAFLPDLSWRSKRAAAVSVLPPASGSGARIPASRKCSRVSPMPCAARS